MSSRHRVDNKLPQGADELDIKGIVVALTFLVGVGLFAGDRDNHSVSEDRQSLSASAHIAPTSTMKNTETLQQPDDDPRLSDRSQGFNALR